MYESEINNRIEGIEQIPQEVQECFIDLRGEVVSRTLLPWGEHCTECAWPTCYTTCDLYVPREDGKCRRFEDGMVRLDLPGSTNSYLLKIRFKRWGKLWAPGTISLVPLEKADRLEQRDRLIGSFLYQLPVPDSVRYFATSKRYSFKKRMTVQARPSAPNPTEFLVECFNPQSLPVNVTLTIRNSKGGVSSIAFQKMIPLHSGYSRSSIPTSEIEKLVDLQAPFSVDLIPNEIDDGTTLVFGLVDFVVTRPAATIGKAEKAKTKVKCIVWDLDHTMWDGILVEDGPARLFLKPGIKDVIAALDQRGILHSVASKNSHDEAMQVLKQFGIDEYFLHPQISWGPKSEALKKIAQRLNIGLDTLMMIDDSTFELAEVKSACPEVYTFSADRYMSLLEMPELQSPVTEESVGRRSMYQQEIVRETVAESFGGNYLQFLKECGMEMTLTPLSEKNLQRVHELTQRTNQMNFSGNRYERKMLEDIIAKDYLDTYVISCQDKFGSYGIVGFSIVDANEPRMTDLMFSCRVQSKRVEHAFLRFLLRKYRSKGSDRLLANYRKTQRNAPSGRVFVDIGMEEIAESNGVTTLAFVLDKPIQDDGIIQIEEK